MSPAPYPAEVRAKGWRFELDLDRVRQSDTWALASNDLRPWLLMLWSTAWEQAPCGSLPADEALIAARIGMPAKTLAKHKAVLLRGWVQADDGRLYHATITELVLAMLKRKGAERQRKAEYRARLSRGTDKGQTGDSGGSDDTGTGTGTRTETQYSEYPSLTTRERSREDAEVEVQAATRYGAISLAIRTAGIGNANPGALDFRALVDAGATADEFLAYADKAKASANPWPYLLSCVKSARAEAAKLGGTLHKGPMPSRGKHSGFESKNYREGVTEDGHIA